jgi:hypothetical protein
MSEDVINKYSEQFHDSKEPVMYQLAKVLCEDHYADGYVSEIYDECFVVKRDDNLRTKFAFNDEKISTKVILLHENGHPAIARRNIFGIRKKCR